MLRSAWGVGSAARHGYVVPCDPLLHPPHNDAELHAPARGHPRHGAVQEGRQGQINGD